MRLLKQLSKFLLSQKVLKLERENLTAFADDGTLIPSGEDYGNQSQEIARFRYQAVIQIERYSAQAELLMALISGWLIEHDGVREFMTLDDPQFNIEYNDDYTSDVEISIEFSEPIEIIADPAGEIVYNGQQWRLEDPEIDTAEHLNV